MTLIAHSGSGMLSMYKVVRRGISGRENEENSHVARIMESV